MTMSTLYPNPQTLNPYVSPMNRLAPQALKPELHQALHLARICFGLLPLLILPVLDIYIYMYICIYIYVYIYICIYIYI